ncbi:beta-ketoacyl-[acyl-carrier-protein] synthase family protein [Pseudodesulfovibrio sediminis]|uniref:3-oxoacyl-[acyl-carrier-protein] synthase 1 n=1 Tax=Pseudodesulfovibrio sediminis TaxID=2810563 RepID=A0ABN6ETQ4_9BACT|nr:beta-ketoacyl-[acyl-carrier-protein] synthase family protein [Pseudodesulfovibrio sediminis]BCS88434.1 beta-ketoacyl synthase [Pseudodesulfovibrio sediminis]
MHEVVITGIGIISVLGNSIESVSTALYRGQSGVIIDEERIGLGFESPLTGAITDFAPSSSLTRKQRKTMTDHAVQAHAAAMEALEMSGLQPEEWQNDQTGIIFGCDSSCLAPLEHVRLLKERGETALIGSGGVFRSMTSNVTMNLNTLLKTQGASWSLSSACSSGGHAVGQGAVLIASGQQERIICGGAQEINWQSMCSFDGLGAFASVGNSPEKACRPFDKDRTGLVPSGGAAVVILERRDLAVKRNATILGTLCGYGFSSDGEHLSVPSKTGLSRAGEMALNNSSLIPGDIDYVCAHATATPAGDIAEATNLKNLFADHSPVISSLKSMTGHELWMSGASQVVYTTLMAQKGFIAPNINLETLTPEAEGLNITPKTIERPPKKVLCNSAGFGGTNSCLVLSY